METVEAAEAQPFERWRDKALPLAQLWRTVIGVVLVIVIWALWTMAVVMSWIMTSLMTAQQPTDIEALIESLIEGRTPPDVMVLLTTFLGIWIGVWVAVRSLHRRRLVTILASDNHIHWREFALGLAVVAGYLVIGVGLSVASGNGPYRSDIVLSDWAMILAPVALLIAFQSSGEELFFRGYIIQNLAARFRSPIVWGFLPSLLFGIGHLGQNGSVAYNLYYLASTVLFGVIAAVVVWRTGGISAVMGMHIGNNLAAFLLAGPDDTMASTQLFLWRTEDMVDGAPFDLGALALLLAYVASPWAPFARRRKEIRAAP